MWRLTSAAVALTLLVPFATAEAKELGTGMLTDAQIKQHENIEMKTLETIQYTVALAEDAQAGDTITIALPADVMLYSNQTSDVKNTEGKVAGNVAFNKEKNEAIVTLNDSAAASKYSQLIVDIPVTFQDTTAGKHTLELPLKNGMKNVDYTVVASAAPATVEGDGTVSGSTISWTVTIDASGATLTNAQLENAFGDSYDLDGPIVVSYKNADGTTSEKKFNSRLLADRTLKLNLGTIKEQVVTISYDTTVIDIEKKYTNNFTIHSLNSDDIVAKAVVNGKGAKVIAPEPEKENKKQSITQSTGQEPLSAKAPIAQQSNTSSYNGVKTTDDVITKHSQNEDSGNTLTELPQTGISNPAWIGAGLLGAAYMIFRRKK